LTLHGVPIRWAIPTSAGVSITVPGTTGNISAGLGNPNLPPGLLGIVSVFAFALTIPTLLLTTQFGVALAHKLSRRSLKIAFGIFWCWSLPGLSGLF
jgi:uncharacterized membrane protein YfcA